MQPREDVTYKWRGDFANAEVNMLHAEGFAHPPAGTDWLAQVTEYSLGWVCARVRARLVGFVNVAWDGGSHAFILDTVVSTSARRQRIGTELLAIAEREARKAECEWLHVDFGERLKAFYIDACGFSSSEAGIVRLAVLPNGQF